MSYLVLARKYRPQNFDELIGQEFVATALKNAISLNRVSHSYLFTGARGVGKTSAARILAKALNCLNPQGANPCNECEHCIEITNGSSMDVLEIDGASNRGIDEIRQLREAVKFIPVKYKYKVYIVDEVHMLTADASNALLKTLEEPPSYVVFIFATTDMHKILPTILSRCQQYDFMKIPYDDMKNALERIYQAESVTYDESSLNLVIRQSEGCMRDALSFSDQIISYTNGKISYESVSKMLGISEDPVVDELFASVLKEDTSSLDRYISRLSDRGVSFVHCTEKMITHTRNLLLLKSGAESLKRELTPDEIGFYRDINAFAPEERLFALFQLWQKLYAELKYSSFARYAFEFGVYKAASLSKIIPIPIMTQNSLSGSGAGSSTAESFIHEEKVSGSYKPPYKKPDKTPLVPQSNKPEPSEPQTVKAGEPGSISAAQDMGEDAGNINARVGNHGNVKGNTAFTESYEDSGRLMSGGELQWHKLLTELKSTEAGLASSLFHSRLELGGNTAKLFFSKERMFNYKRAVQPDNIKKLEKFLSLKFERPLRVEIILDSEGDNGLAIKKEELESIYEKKIREDFMAEPVINDFMKNNMVKASDLKVVKND